MAASPLRIGEDDDQQRMAEALAALAQGQPPRGLVPPPTNEVAAAPAGLGSALARAMFPGVVGGQAFAPRPPPSMTPSATPPPEAPTAAGVIEPNRMWGAPRAETLPPEGAAGGKLPTADPRAAGLGIDLAQLASLGVGGPSAAGSKAVFALAAARTAAEKAALARATELAAAGAHPNKIWRASQLFESPDKQWLTEIPDIASAMRKGNIRDYTPSPLGQHFSHPELYGEVPGIANIQTQRMSPAFMEMLGGNTAGAYQAATAGRPAKIYYNPEGMILGGKYRTPREILLHEINHAIAQRQGLPMGSSPEVKNLTPRSPEWRFYQNYLDELNAAVKEGRIAPRTSSEIDEAARAMAASKGYHVSAGEAASRGVQRRMDMPEGQLAATSPRTTIERDVPYAEQIVRYDKYRPARMGEGAPGKSIGDDLANLQTMSEPLRRQEPVRGRSGRPIQTAPLPIGTEEAILSKGYERATGPRLPDDVRAAVERALAENDYYHYGLRVHDEPLKVGGRAPPSRQWIEGDPVPDEVLGGTSTMGLRSAADVEHALRSAEITPMDYVKALQTSPYKHSTYPGQNVSLLRSDRRSYGNDPGEWILPDAEVMATWAKQPPLRQAMSRSGPVAGAKQPQAPGPQSLPTIVQSAVNIGGKIHLGPWHGAAYEKAAHTMGVPVDSLIDRYAPGAEGFLTSTGKFVSREEAMNIAIRAGQIEPTAIESAPWPLNKQLTSEHLAMFGLAGTGLGAAMSSAVGPQQQYQ